MLRCGRIYHIVSALKIIVGFNSFIFFMTNTKINLRYYRLL